MEVRRHEGRVWRVDFDDEDETSIYVSGQDGAVLERRNSTWRLFDIFWMLHIMDYDERADAHNPLLITAQVTGLVFTLMGIWLLFYSFNRRRKSRPGAK